MGRPQARSTLMTMLFAGLALTVLVDASTTFSEDAVVPENTLVDTLLQGKIGDSSQTEVTCRPEPRHKTGGAGPDQPEP